MMLGPYRLDRALGTGGMAEVWLATHSLTGKQVAVKLLKVSSSELFREARAHARLRHSNILRLFDYGEAEKPYLSMEVMSGTLRDILPLRSLDQFADVILPVLEGLAFAHARGVIHRDLKPENILYLEGEKKVYKLADFGIAQALGDIARNDIYQSAGTPVYMAPEQFFGSWQDIGPWTDIYALGCMVYELITGGVPFVGESLPKLAFQHLNESLVRRATLFPIPTSLWDWIEAMTAKMPEQRIAHAADAIDWLRTALESDIAPSNLAQYIPDADPYLPTIQSGTLEYTPLPPIDFAAAQSRGQQARRSFPMTWRSHTSERAQLDTDGLGLFALREVPVVGRMHVRDLIWQTLREVVEQQTLRQVGLRATDIQDAEHLATWLSTHASEQGIAQVFTLVQTPSLNPHDGFVGLAEALLRARRCNADQTMARGSKLGKDGEVLGALLLARVHGQLEQLPGMAATFVSTARLLARATLERPVILLVHGSQWDEDILDWLQNLHLECHSHALMVLVTSQDPPPHTTVIDVPQINTQDMHELLRTMLPLDTQLLDDIVQKSGADSEFARQILTDLVERRAVVQGTEHTLRLNDDELLPDSPQELFMRRLDRVLRLYADDPQIANASLELAAVLGIAPDPQGFSRLCQRVRIPIPTALIAGMLDAGLLKGDEDRWYFSHPALLDCLKQRAVLNQRWARWNIVAAELFLEDVGHDTPSENWAEIGRLFAQGEQPRRALEPLYRATINQTRSVKACKRYRDLRASLLIQSGTSAQSADGVLQIHLDALIQHHEGDLTGAVETLSRALDICSADDTHSPKSGFEYAQAMCLKQLGIVFVTMGDERVTKVLTLACESFGLLGESLEEATCAGYLGFVYTQQGDARRAESFYRIGITGYEIQQAPRRAATLGCYLAHNLASQDRFAEALDCLTSSVHIARQYHDHYAEFLAEQALGEIYRFSFDFERARQHLQAAWTLAVDLGDGEKRACRYNLAVLNLAVGIPHEALHYLRVSDVGFELPDCFAVATQIAQARTKDELEQIEDQWKDSIDHEIQWLMQIGKTLVS